jgi:hypothetical protein
VVGAPGVTGSAKVLKTKTVTSRKAVFKLKLKPGSKAKVCVTAHNTGGASSKVCATKRIPK